MGVVCDGVGGLSQGELASSTVVERFARWFELELPSDMASMGEDGAFSPAKVRVAWDGMLSELNDLILSQGASGGRGLGTTFSGVIACDGWYLVGHVGDCRAYHLGHGGFRRLTRDQTLLARRTASAGPVPGGRHVILQAVGAQPTLAPEYAVGRYAEGDLFALCSDGAWDAVGDGGVCRPFLAVDRGDSRALDGACRSVLVEALACEGSDNITVACLGVGVRGGASAAPTVVLGGGD